MDMERRPIPRRSESSHRRPASFEISLSPTMPKSSLLAQTAVLVDAIARQDEVDGIVGTALQGLSACFGYRNILLLLHDPVRGVLTTIGSHGYEQAGIGSEVPVGEGLVGAVAAEGRLVSVSGGSRIERFAGAARKAPGHDDDLSTGLPGLPNALSQIGVPMIVQGNIHGVLFAESAAPHAFSAEDEAALTIVARQVAASLVLARSPVGETQASGTSEAAASAEGRSFRVSYHPLDDSVFIDNDYLIKGVAGRLLMFMLDMHQREGRSEFTNREIRLSTAMRLPGVKDNLDTRLILLRRRLDERNVPIRIVRIGRGRIRLQIFGTPVLERIS